MLCIRLTNINIGQVLPWDHSSLCALFSFVLVLVGLWLEIGIYHDEIDVFGQTKSINTT